VPPSSKHKGDAAQFTLEEILEPSGWTLLNFLMDPRNGLGRFREFRISNCQLMMELIDACTTLSVEEILALPDVAERVERYLEHADKAAEQIGRCATVRGNLVVLDLRDEEIIHPTKPLHDPRALPPVQHLDPRALGPQAAEHGVRDRQVDHR
jgi:hypothetical protein